MKSVRHQTGQSVQDPDRMTSTSRSAKKAATQLLRLWPVILVVALTLAVIVLQSTGLLGSATPDNPEETATDTAGLSPTGEPSPTQAMPSVSPTPTGKPDVHVVLAAVGDIILHQSVIDGGRVAGSDPVRYDFTTAFTYVSPILSAADLTLANYEGTLAGPKYSGYPFFCAPDEIADALKLAGVDVVWTANNHTLDRGLSGVIRTAQVFLDKGFTVVGTRPDLSKSTDTVLDVKGIRIGLMAYTFETIGTETKKALNGIEMPTEADPLIDSFNPYRADSFETDIAALLERASVLREEGAELIVLSMHWGNEYQTSSSSFQRKLAQRLCDAGIELIIGHHPHVLQEIDVLHSSLTGQPTLVFYSIGNFLHNMEFTTHDSHGNAQDAIIARISLLKTADGISIKLAEYIPTYVVRIAKGDDQVQHLIVPVLPGLQDPGTYRTNVQEMQSSLDRITAILGESHGDDQIPVRQAER